MHKPLSLSSISEQPNTEGTFRPQLTSLIDVMTILLVFLIKSFSVEGNLVTPSPDLQLPLSISKTPPKPTCSIIITKDAVLTGEIGPVVPLADVYQSDSLLIPLLYSWMLAEKEKCEDSQKPLDVMIQADRETEFNIVKRVMFTCSRAGYSDFSVLVLEED